MTVAHTVEDDFRTPNRCQDRVIDTIVSHGLDLSLRSLVISVVFLHPVVNVVLSGAPYA